MFKHFTCSFWILLLHSLSATTSNMTVRVRVEAKLQCLGASSLEAGLLSTPFVLYLFPSFQTGPELDGNSKACSKSIDCMDEARLVFFSKCLYFVQPIKDLLSNNECIEYYKWVIKFKKSQSQFPNYLDSFLFLSHIFVQRVEYWKLMGKCALYCQHRTNYRSW